MKIGDEWMAIQIIARSQTNPQKAVAELPSIITVEVVGYETSEPRQEEGDARKRKARPASE